VREAGSFREFCLAIAEEAGMLEPVGFVASEPGYGGTWPRVRSKLYRFPDGSHVEEELLDDLVELLWSLPGVRASFIKARVSDITLYALMGASSGPMAEFLRSQALYDIDAVLEPSASFDSASGEGVAAAIKWLRDRGGDGASCERIRVRLNARLQMPVPSPSPVVAPTEERVAWTSEGPHSGVLCLDGPGPEHTLRFSREWGAAALALAVSAIATR